MTHPDRHSVQAAKAAGFGAQEWESEAWRPADFQRQAYVQHLRSGGAQDLAGGQLGKVDPNAIKYVLDKGAGRVTRINEVTRAKLQKLVEEGLAKGMSARELGDYIQASTLFSEYRAERIARTEMRMAYNAAALGTYQSMGVSMVVAKDGDKDEQCAARDGKTFSVLDAYGIEDHPNGTLDWLPIAPAKTPAAPTGTIGTSHPTPLPKGMPKGSKLHVKWDKKLDSYVDKQGNPVEWDALNKTWVAKTPPGLDSKFEWVSQGKVKWSNQAGGYVDNATGEALDFVEDAAHPGFGKWTPKPKPSGPITEWAESDPSIVYDVNVGHFIHKPTGQLVKLDYGDMKWKLKGPDPVPDAFGKYGPDFTPEYNLNASTGYIDAATGDEVAWVSEYNHPGGGYWEVAYPKPKLVEIPTGNIKTVPTNQSATGYIDKTTGKPVKLDSGKYYETGEPSINPNGYHVWKEPDGSYVDHLTNSPIEFDDVAKQWVPKLPQAPAPVAPPPAPNLAPAVPKVPNSNALSVPSNQSKTGYIDKTTGKPIQQLPDGTWVETGDASINPQGFHVWKNADGTVMDKKTGNEIIFSDQKGQWIEMPKGKVPSGEILKGTKSIGNDTFLMDGTPVHQDAQGVWQYGRKGPAGAIDESVLNPIVDTIPKQPTSVADRVMTAWQKAIKAGRAELKRYTGSEYRPINAFLRHTQSFTKAEEQAWQAVVDGIDKTMTPLATDVRVTRGAGSNAFPGYSSLEEALKVGNHHIDAGFMSTSVAETWTWGGEVIIDLHVPAGTPAVYAQVISHHTSEYELLLGRGQEMVIDAVKHVPGGPWYVKAHLV